MPLTVGGGVRTVDDIRTLLLAGADKASINTAAVHGRNSSKRRRKNSVSQCIVVAIDAKKVAPASGRSSPMAAARRPAYDAVEWARKMAKLRAPGEILLTSMDKDGTKTGFDLALTRKIADAVDIPVIASGGVGTLTISPKA